MSRLDRQLRPTVAAMRERVVGLRRDFHAHPELSWQESRTQERIIARLRSLGVANVRPIARTGATGVVEGSKRGPCLLWRADIDALPIPERSGVAFASLNPGVMHACGHDVHAAIALGLAEALMAERQQLRGRVRLVFQPAEEDAGGADACIAEGVLDDPEVRRVLGLHISADLPLGTVNVAPGPFFAAPTMFEVTLRGRGGHAAAPHQAIDAVVVAAHVVTALQTIVSRSVAPSDASVLTVGTIEGGFRWNVIAESARLTGTIRSYTDRLREHMLERLEEVVAGVCAAFGAEYEVSHNTSCPPLVNDPDVAAFVAGQAAQIFGAENIVSAASFGADDMALFLAQRPGCYFWLGARNEAKGIAGRHHDPSFTIDEDAIPIGVEFAARLVEGSLEELR